MSKRKRRPQVEAPAEPKRDPIAHWYLQCPLCWSGHGGLGSQYGRSPSGMVIYYRCRRCGHTWKIQREHLEQGVPRTNMSPPPADRMPTADVRVPGEELELRSMPREWIEPRDFSD